jgi:predicted nucleic acid-binding protein
MIVVADTSPLNYLTLIDEIGVLERLFDVVVIPKAVHNELLHSAAPQKVRDWAGHLPSWVEVHSASDLPDADLSAIEMGEREAICLAEQLFVKLILIDDREGRRVAVRRGFDVMGTVGILQRAAHRALLDLPTAIQRLQQTSFYISPTDLARLLSNKPSLAGLFSKKRIEVGRANTVSPT